MRVLFYRLCCLIESKIDCVKTGLLYINLNTFPSCCNLCLFFGSRNDKDTVVDNATLSNTAFKISIPVTTTDKIDYKALYDRENRKSIYDLIALQKEYVETSDGKRFEASNDGNNHYRGVKGEEKITDYAQTFNLTKFDATDELTVHIFTNSGKEIIIEFEKEK